MKLTHRYSEYLLRQASQRPLRAWEAAWLRRHLARCPHCAAMATELLGFLRSELRLAPSTAQRLAQRLHQALQSEDRATRPAFRPGWALAWGAGLGVAAALALILLPKFFNPSAGIARSLAQLSLEQGQAQGLTDPLQPTAQLPNTPSPQPAASGPTPATIPTMAPTVPAMGNGLTITPVALDNGLTITPAALSNGLTITPVALGNGLTITPVALDNGLTRPAFTATCTPTSTPVLAHSLTDTAGLLTTPVPSLNPPTALPSMSGSSPASSLTPSQSLPSIPGSSLTPAGQ